MRGPRPPPGAQGGEFRASELFDALSGRHCLACGRRNRAQGATCSSRRMTLATFPKFVRRFEDDEIGCNRLALVPALASVLSMRLTNGKVIPWLASRIRDRTRLG